MRVLVYFLSSTDILMAKLGSEDVQLQNNKCHYQTVFRKEVVEEK